MLSPREWSSFSLFAPYEGHVEVICQTQVFSTRLPVVQLDFFLRPAQPQPRGSNVLLVGGKEVVVRLFPNRHARRYILRLSADGSARVTVPRGGSRKAALDFAQRNVTWIEQQLQKRHAQKNEIAGWRHGSEIFFRGQRVVALFPEVIEKLAHDLSIIFLNYAENVIAFISFCFWIQGFKEEGK